MKPKRNPKRAAAPATPPIHPAPSLELCPFCKHGRIIATMHEGPFYYLLCVMCQATGPREQTKAAAVLAWNRRAPRAMSETVVEQ